MRSRACSYTKGRGSLSVQLATLPYLAHNTHASRIFKISYNMQQNERAACSSDVSFILFDIIITIFFYMQLHHYKLAGYRLQASITVPQTTMIKGACPLPPGPGLLLYWGISVALPGAQFFGLEFLSIQLLFANRKIKYLLGYLLHSVDGATRLKLNHGVGYSLYMFMVQSGWSAIVR